MVRALKNPDTDPTYLEFFGLTRPPFARLSRPSQSFHTEQYSLLMDHLASATEQADCLVVICGPDGSGKTTLLNRYISSLADDISFATIDETCDGEKQFHCAILRQLGFSDITGTRHELRHITKEFLVHRGLAGDTVLLMIDNAHLISPTVLDQLRWISAIKVKDRRVLSVVLAGNPDLARVMDSPAMSEIEFHSHVRFNIRMYTEEETANYIWHHLRLAGGIDAVKFSNGAYPLIHRYAAGIPRLINMLCDDVLAGAYALESRLITEDLVRTVADKRQILPHVVPLQDKARRKTDPDFKRTNKEPVDRLAPGPAKPEADGKNLLEHVSQLAEQVGQLRADRMRALQDVGRRDKDISDLRNKLDAQSEETEKLGSALADSTAENGRLHKALSDSEKALQKSEKAAKKVAADLEQERSRAKTAKADSVKAAAREVSRLKSALKAAATDLKLLEESRKQCEALRLRIADLENLEESISKKDTSIADLKAGLALYSHEIMALEARNEELESRNRQREQAEAISMVGPESEDQPNARSTEQSDPVITAFEVVRDGEIEQVIEAAESPPRIMIGRSENSDLCLDSEFVSRHHALLFCTERGPYIEDLNSFNGTIVNSRKVTRCDLRIGDIVMIGDFEIRPIRTPG